MHQKKKKKNLKVLPHFRQNVQIPSAVRCSEHWKSFHAAYMQLNPQHNVFGNSEITDNNGESGRRKCERHKTTTPVSLSLSLTLSLALRALPTYKT